MIFYISDNIDMIWDGHELLSHPLGGAEVNDLWTPIRKGVRSNNAANFLSKQILFISLNFFLFMKWVTRSFTIISSYHCPPPISSSCNWSPYHFSAVSPRPATGLWRLVRPIRHSQSAVVLIIIFLTQNCTRLLVKKTQRYGCYTDNPNLNHLCYILHWRDQYRYLFIFFV